MLKTKIAKDNKVWAYKNNKNEEVVLDKILYLGINDNGERYYEIDTPNLQENING